ncbi:MarR family winged helix-turn-helix transcriptional regulator [Micromonospora sp. NPDC000089]|uniref:MarR family winged helix-turn-helix transcriptional regulator n=1 Tax=unclassified Micromonospora TaxID=2617518 RepID=UPI0036930ED1
MERLPVIRPLPDDADDELIDGLSAFSRTVVGMTARILTTLDVDVTLPQFRTLVILSAEAPLRTLDLAAALHVHPSTATRTCDRLTRRGLVARHHRSPDRRVAWLTPTEAGRALVGEVMRGRRAELRTLLRAGDAARLRSTGELLDAMVVAAGERTERDWWQRWERCTRNPVPYPAAPVENPVDGVTNPSVRPAGREG